MLEKRIEGQQKQNLKRQKHIDIETDRHRERERDTQRDTQIAKIKKTDTEREK